MNKQSFEHTLVFENASVLLDNISKASLHE
jgi:hypothetical protein